MTVSCRSTHSDNGLSKVPMYIVADIQGDSLGSKEPPLLKMGVVWLKVGVFQGKLMKKKPLVRVLDPPLMYFLLCV